MAAALQPCIAHDQLAVHRGAVGTGDVAGLGRVDDARRRPPVRMRQREFAVAKHVGPAIVDHRGRRAGHAAEQCHGTFVEQG